MRGWNTSGECVCVCLWPVIGSNRCQQHRSGMKQAQKMRGWMDVCCVLYYCHITNCQVMNEMLIWHSTHTLTSERDGPYSEQCIARCGNNGPSSEGLSTTNTALFLPPSLSLSIVLFNWLQSFSALSLHKVHFVLILFPWLHRLCFP